MSQQKRKASHPSIKQYLCSRPKQKSLPLASQKVQTPAVVTVKILSLLLCRKDSIQRLESQKHHQFQLTVSQQHLRIRLFNDGLNWKVLMNPYKWICSLYAGGDVTCLLCSKHQAVTTGRGKNGNIYTTEPARPPRPNRLDNHVSSDQQQKANSLEITQRISLFHASRQDRIWDKVNTVAERVHLIYILSFERTDSKTWWTALAIMIGFATSAIPVLWQ